MTHFLIALGVILLANMMPAFAPPTWAILVFFALSFQINALALVIGGVAMATLGRVLLALFFRRFSRFVPQRFVENLESVGEYFSAGKKRQASAFLLFFISPVSSAQLFEAIGMMKNVRLLPIAGFFAGGRLVSYSFYVAGSSALKTTSYGELFKKEISSPTSIVIQVLMIFVLVGIGFIPWKRVLHMNNGEDK